ncbi:ATP synthase subunit I [Aliidiomarina indica]|uniref:ATP synthase subunit I n=1 Tax=Aliidiomarina indica TaxID=2749147 RepID=UPI00188F062A|nr:ATP synthase subunit I [Aliidiomarina indica]
MAAQHHHEMTHKGRILAKRLIRLQALSAAILIFIFGLTLGIPAVITATAGAIIGLLPNIVFAAFAFRTGGARAAPAVVNSFYVGEGLKIALTMCLFVMAFVFLEGPWLPLFVVFGVITILHWLAPILHLKIN